MDFKSSLVIDMKGDDSVIVGRRATTKNEPSCTIFEPKRHPLPLRS